MNSVSEEKKNSILLFLSSGLLRNIIFTIGAIALFYGVIIYGVVLKLREVPLSDAIASKGFQRTE